MKIYDLWHKADGSLIVLPQVLVVALPKRSQKNLTSHGLERETGLSTNTVDNFVDSLLQARLNPFRTRDFLTLTKKEAAKLFNEYKALKKMARTIDSRASFIFIAPILCISRGNGA